MDVTERLLHKFHRRENNSDAKLGEGSNVSLFLATCEDFWKFCSRMPVVEDFRSISALRTNVAILILAIERP